MAIYTVVDATIYELAPTSNTFGSYRPFDFWLDQFAVAGALTATPTEITALGDETWYPFDESDLPTEVVMTLTGSFTYGPLGTVSGTVTGYTVAYDDVVMIEVTQMNADASQYWASLLSAEVNDHGRYGFAGNDVLSGGEGDEALRGYGGNDRLEGLGGADSLSGGGGRDTVLGGNGDDFLFGGGGRDRVDGGNGADELFGGSGVDTLLGGRGDDFIAGGRGNDTINGGRGNDDLGGDNRPSDVEDFIRGFTEGEFLIAERGMDVFRFKRGDGNDTIWDFDQGLDTIHIANGANNFGALEIVDDSREFFLNFGGSVTIPVAIISFANVTISVIDATSGDFTADDFSF